MKQWALSLCALIVLNLGWSSYADAQTLDENEQIWRSSVARFCGEYPSKENCDDGDSVLFNGLLCMSGEELGCKTVRDSQDASGQFWRSPRRNPNNLNEKSSFSRDQTLGVLLYLAKTRDTAAALSWMRWIEENAYCAVKNPSGEGCLVTIHRVCLDSDNGSCTMTASLWGLTRKVWDALGLLPNRPMQDFNNADVSDLEIAAAAIEEPGYKLHLKAVSSFLRLTLGESLTRSKRIVEKLYARESANPFFQLLAEGPSEPLTAHLLDVCPKPTDSLDYVRFQWAWERATSEQAWRKSMGWDCIFMANLIRNYNRDLTPFQIDFE